jgi:hypothetical protein
MRAPLSPYPELSVHRAMNPHVPACRPVTREHLAMLLEDALSAATGWTVAPPRIQLLHGGPARGNWAVDLDRMDDGLRSVVARMQQRYCVRTAPANWLARVAGILAGRRHGGAEHPV